VAKFVSGQSLTFEFIITRKSECKGVKTPSPLFLLAAGEQAGSYLSVITVSLATHFFGSFIYKRDGVMATNK
jgi:hypothetical protein